VVASNLLSKKITAGEKSLKRTPLIRRLNRLGERGIACFTNARRQTRYGTAKAILHPHGPVEILRHV
jgi:hypothetical protein